MAGLLTSTGFCRLTLQQFMNSPPFLRGFVYATPSRPKVSPTTPGVGRLSLPRSGSKLLKLLVLRGLWREAGRTQSQPVCSLEGAPRRPCLPGGAPLSTLSSFRCVHGGESPDFPLG